MATQTKKTERTKSKRPAGDKRWVAKVKTVSTFPPRETFNQEAETVAKVMASKKVSPKGIGSGIRMIQYFINRAGKNLPAARKRELEKAKRILQERARNEKSRAGGRSRSRSRAS
jgi:tRNA(adenine34) deaminase